jgi:peptidoglycan/xylan/chitin deacetylase (PgdA/CDA1 family)
LTFHGLGEPPKSVGESERRVWVPVGWLHAILQALSGRVQLTFDDGNSSDTELVLPALQENERTARFFPLAGRIDQPGYLGAEDIAALSAAGMTIGSQGVQHRPWRTLPDRELEQELLGSRTRLGEIVGHEVTEAACPFGSYDRRVLRALRAAGYERVFNSDGGTCPASAWLSARTTVHRDLPLEYWLALAGDGASHRPGALRRCKRLLKRVR